jgi:uncharacterized protein (DUF2336 family)
MQVLSQTASLISELETAVQNSSPDQRVATLRRITDLFLANADQVGDEQVGLFEDVLLHLVTRVENRALSELGARMAPVGNAPYSVVRHLAQHHDVTVAAPVLAHSTRLTDGDLVEIAQTRSQGHLYAIAERPRLSEQVTDVLVDRGSREVAHRVATNAGAAFSERGFARLVDRAQGDDALSEQVGLRLDLPPALLRELLQRATEAVRTRILQSAPLDAREEIQRVVSRASNEIVREAIAPRDFAPAQRFALQLKDSGRLDEAAVQDFAKARKYEEMVAAVAALGSAPIDMIHRLMQCARPDGLIVVCKAAEFKWPTVGAVLTNRFGQHSVSAPQLQEARADFLMVSVSTAQRVMRFWLVREAAGKAA